MSKELGRSLELTAVIVGSPLISLSARDDSLLQAVAHYSFNICSSVSLPLSPDSSVGAISGRESAQPAHLPEAQKCGGGNAVGDNLPPMKGGVDI